MSDSDQLYEQCLDLVRPDDVRFGFSDQGASLGAVLRGGASPGARACAARLRSACRRSFSEDLADIAATLAYLRFAGYPDTVRNAIQVLTSRFELHARQQQLADIGAILGVSKQRVDQMVRRTLEPLRSQSLVCPAAVGILHTLDGLVPLPLERAEAETRSLRGEASVMDVLDFVRIVQAREPGLARSRIPKGRAAATVLLDRGRLDVDALAKVWRAAISLCGQSGATQLSRLLDTLFDAARDDAARETLVGQLQQHARFRWLDEAGGWFAVSDGRASVLQRRLEKLFAALPGPYTLSEIERILSEDPVYQSQARGRTLPSHVLGALLSGWSWLQRSVGPASEDLAFTRAPSARLKGALTGIERLIVDELRKGQGSARGSEMRQRVSAELGLTPIALHRTLRLTPIVKRVGWDLYAFNGPGDRDACSRRPEAEQSVHPALLHFGEAEEKKSSP